MRHLLRIFIVLLFAIHFNAGCKKSPPPVDDKSKSTDEKKEEKKVPFDPQKILPG